jgi:hypothetical protein
MKRYGYDVIEDAIPSFARKITKTAKNPVRIDNTGPRFELRPLE